MASWHQIVVVGHLGKDAVQKFTQSGKSFWVFSVAVTDRFGDRDNRREATTWYEVALWEESANGVTEYLKKGKQVMVVGRPGSRAWKTQDGTPVSTNTISARTVQLLGRTGSGRPDEGDWFAQQDAANYGYTDEETTGGNIPF